ncbi:proton-conducting transporter transmembrane domain-containing protein [Candidatus Nitrospira bockiana]
MSASLLVLPLVVPLLTAAGCLFARGHRRIQRLLSVLGAAALPAIGAQLLARTVADGILSTQIGGWAAPFGITLVADLLSGLMVLLTGVVALAVVVYSLATADPWLESIGYHPALHALFAGICAALLAGDLFNLYVWFEVMLIASFVLLSLGGDRAQLEGALTYVTLNLIASAFFLTGIAFLYGLAGTLNLADLSTKLQPLRHGAFVATSAMLFLVAFGIKAAVFPLFFWLPASYHTPPFAVSAVFAGLLTKVGVYALVRLSSLLFLSDHGPMQSAILVLAGFTMAVGVLGALAQREVRRLLSFLLIGHIGFIIWGLGLFTAHSLAGSVFYLLHHMLAITNLFLISGIIHWKLGSESLLRLGGLFRSAPGLAVLFIIPAFALAGFPPLSGFVAKVLLVKAGLEVGGYGLVAVALAADLLTLYAVSTIWEQAFWKPLAGENESRHGGSWLTYGPVAGLAVLTVLLGLVADPAVRLSSLAADQLMHPERYIRAVQDGGRG